jgi:hypothetical protein
VFLGDNSGLRNLPYLLEVPRKLVSTETENAYSPPEDEGNFRNSCYLKPVEGGWYPKGVMSS